MAVPLRRSIDRATIPTMAQHWSKNLSKRLALKSGQQLVTLRDAGDCLVQIFGTVIKSAPLEYAGELLIRAAKTSKRADIKAATEQVERVLQLQPLM